MAKRAAKKVEYSKHALLRRARRRISHREIVLAIRDPDRTGLPTKPGREHVSKSFTAGTVHVVFVEKRTRYLVVTVWRKS